MAEVTLRTPAGADSGTVGLDDTVFGVQPNVAVLHQVVTAQLAARRAGTQSTRTRAEVRGGGKKPYKQKGTGRARQGSTRAPQFAGGGVALGPKPRSYRQRTPKKMVRLALRSALSDRAAEGRVVVVDRWGFDAPSTKAALEAVRALGLDGSVLVVVDHDDEVVSKSFRNLPEVQVILAAELNAYDVLCNRWIVFTRATLPGSGEGGSAEDAGAEAAVEPEAAEGGDAAVEPEAAEGAEAAVEPEAAEGGDAAIEPEAAEGAEAAVEPEAAEGGEADRGTEPVAAELAAHEADEAADTGTEPVAGEAGSSEEDQA